jgi:hypothetical protein
VCDDDFWSRQTNEREGCRVESRVDSSARNALSRETRNAFVRAAGSARVFYKRPVAHFCSLFSLSTDDDDDDGGVDGVVFLSEILRRRRPPPRRRCALSRRYEMKKDSRFCSVLFCRPNRQPIRSVQNYQRHGRDHDSSRQESPETEPPS